MRQRDPNGVEDDASGRDRRWLGIIAVGVGLLSLLIVLPYLQYVLAAVVLAYVFYPLRRRLAPRYGRTWTAITLLVVSVLAVLVPLALLISVAIQQAAQLADAIAAGELGVAEFEERLAEFGIETDLLDLYEQLQEPIEIAARGLADQAAGIVGGLPDFFIGLTVLLFVLYSLLRDGDRAVSWVETVLPVRPEVSTELFTRVERLMYVAIIANVAVAGVQALLTTIGLALVGMPSLVFFFILTFVLSLLPLIGAFMVWAPVSIYLVVIGEPIAGGLLFVYGSIFVSMSDNALRPIAVGRGAKMSVATVIIGIFGGVAVLGLMGLFFGPVVLGMFKSVVELYAREAERERPSSIDGQSPEGDVGTVNDRTDERSSDRNDVPAESGISDSSHNSTRDAPNELDEQTGAVASEGSDDKTTNDDPSDDDS